MTTCPCFVFLKIEFEGKMAIPVVIALTSYQHQGHISVSLDLTKRKLRTQMHSFQRNFDGSVRCELIKAWGLFKKSRKRAY